MCAAEEDAADASEDAAADARAGPVTSSDTCYTFYLETHLGYILSPDTSCDLDRNFS